MAKKFSKNSYFKNRELSWIDFNGRLLEEARDADNPLLERINFLGITQSNVDEFFMVRVASLNKLVSVKINDTDPSGMTPKSAATCGLRTQFRRIRGCITSLRHRR